MAESFYIKWFVLFEPISVPDDDDDGDDIDGHDEDLLWLWAFVLLDRGRPSFIDLSTASDLSCGHLTANELRLLMKTTAHSQIHAV